MTGKQLFLQNFFACATIRYQRRTLEGADYRRLLRSINKHTEPSIKTLAKCFPKMVEALEKFAAERELKMWDPKTVQTFCFARAQKLAR